MRQFLLHGIKLLVKYPIGINKNAFIRYRVIDTLLRLSDSVKTTSIVDKLWADHDLDVSSRTINKDIMALQTDFEAPIKYDNSKKAYYYPDNVEEIFPSLDLREDELNALRFYAKTLQQYKGFDVFKDFTNAIDKVVDAVNIRDAKNKTNNKIIVQPENYPKFKGSELIPQIMSGFDKNQQFKIDYIKHTSNKPKSYTVTPILLKEYDGLWYLITQINEEFRTFALDRIYNFSLTELENEKVTDFNHEEYFNHAFGISVSNGEVEEIILEFDTWRGKYLLSSPIHKSQKFIKEVNDKMHISLRVIPYHELYAKILSYGTTVRVLAPEILRLKIKTLLKETLEKY